MSTSGSISSFLPCHTSQMLVGKSVAYGGEDDTQYGRILRAHANKVTLSPYVTVDDQSIQYADLSRTMKEEQLRVDNLLFQTQKLSASLQPSAAEDSGNVELMILEWTQRRLEKIEPQQLKKLCSLTKPSEPTFTILSAAAALILGLTTAPTWATTRRTISSAGFPAATQSTGASQLPTDVYNFVLDTFLGSSHFNSLSNETASEGPLLDVLLMKKWITAVMDYQRSRFGVNDHVEIQQQIDACQLSLASSQRRLCDVQEQMRLVRSGFLLSLDTTSRMVKDASAIRFIVPDSAVRDGGKILNVEECHGVSAPDANLPHPDQSPQPLGADLHHTHVHRDSHAAAVGELARVLEQLATEHHRVFDEYKLVQAQRNTLLNTAQYLLVCIDDQKEECVQLRRALTSSRKNNLIGKSLIRLLRASQDASRPSHVTSTQATGESHIQSIFEMSRLATSTDEFLRGLCATRCL